MMKDKYNSVGLNYEQIVAQYPNLNEYEEIVNAYLSDPFFNELEEMLNDEDYEMAKDAVKGLFILAQDIYLYPMYVALMEVYEDLMEEIYEDVHGHYEEVMQVYKRLTGVFHV